MPRQQCEVQDCEYPHCPRDTGGPMNECPGCAPMECGHGLEFARIVKGDGYLSAEPLYWRMCAKCEEEAENAAV